jgi:hypothetical protein
MAIIYSLSGGGIQVDYTVGSSFVFKQGGTTKTFTGAEIKIDQTGLGTLVEVPLVLTIDTGGSRFGVFVPAVQLTPGQSVPVSTVGVTESFGGPNSIPRRPTTWSCVGLQGTVADVLPHIVPLYAVAIQNSIASGDLAQMQDLSAQADRLMADQGDLGGAVTALNAQIAKLQPKAK